MWLALAGSADLWGVDTGGCVHFAGADTFDGPHDKVHAEILDSGSNANVIVVLDSVGADGSAFASADNGFVGDGICVGRSG